MSGMKTRLFLTLCRVKMGAFSLICYQGGASDGKTCNVLLVAAVNEENQDTALQLL